MVTTLKKCKILHSAISVLRIDLQIWQTSEKHIQKIMSLIYFLDL